jgi:hypothetical protein
MARETSFTPLQIEVLPGGSHYKLIADMIVFSHRIGVTVVPAGFVTDMASVPRGFWNLFPPTGPYAKAAVYHDYLYQLGSISRADADSEFVDGMKALGVCWITRAAMWVALRLFGWKAWDEYTLQRVFVGEMDTKD